MGKLTNNKNHSTLHRDTSQPGDDGPFEFIWVMPLHFLKVGSHFESFYFHFHSTKYCGNRLGGIRLSWVDSLRDWLGCEWMVWWVDWLAGGRLDCIMSGCPVGWRHELWVGSAMDWRATDLAAVKTKQTTIHLSIQRSTQSIYPAIYPSNNPSIHPTIHPSNDLSIIQRSIHPMIHPSNNPSTQPAHLHTKQPTIHTSSHSMIHTMIQPSIHLPNQPTYKPTNHTSKNPPTQQPTINPDFTCSMKLIWTNHSNRLQNSQLTSNAQE